MKMLFASDSFKGSLTAVEICDLLQEAAADIFPDAETVSLPIADGGEGTVDALLCAMGGKRMTTRVTGPLFAPVDAQWGLLGDGQTAVLEMAQGRDSRRRAACRMCRRRSATRAKQPVTARVS